MDGSSEIPYDVNVLADILKNDKRLKSHVSDELRQLHGEFSFSTFGYEVSDT